MIKSEIAAHSTNKHGEEVISVLSTFPRIILAEVNTHRMLSKNTSSSRAIPFDKLLEMVQENPFIPIAWQKEHKGMQGNEYFSETDLYFENGQSYKEYGYKNSVDYNIDQWLNARNTAIEQAIILSNNKVTKQLCNRLLEPFMWTTMLITGSREGWDNFFTLRCPNYLYEGQYSKNNPAIKPRQYKSKKDWCEEYSWNYSDDPPQVEKPRTDLDWLKINKGQAEIHMMALAESIYDAVNESTPRLLEVNQWHIPFLDKINSEELNDILHDINYVPKNIINGVDFLTQAEINISVALAARTSYTVVGEEKTIDYEAMINLHDRLLSQDPPHSSPLEHCAKCMDDSEYYTFNKGQATDCDDEGGLIFEGHSQGWCNNLKGFINYRYMIDNQVKL